HRGSFGAVADQLACGDQPRRIRHAAATELVDVATRRGYRGGITVGMVWRRWHLRLLGEPPPFRIAKQPHPDRVRCARKCQIATSRRTPEARVVVVVVVVEATRSAAPSETTW